MTTPTLHRRAFLARLGGVLAPLALGVSPLGATPLGATPRAAGADRPGRRTRRDGPGGHPDPRPGIDGSRVLPADRVPPHVAELFDGVRSIPEVVDGIRCRCGCADVEGMYSLLSCYEATGMARFCEICQGEGRLVVRLHGEGLGLEAIRAEVDRRFG